MRDVIKGSSLDPLRLEIRPQERILRPSAGKIAANRLARFRHIGRRPPRPRLLRNLAASGAGGSAPRPFDVLSHLIEAIEDFTANNAHSRPLRDPINTTAAQALLLVIGGCGIG
ncbi:MAG: hypothetical protein E5X80_14635 [Mesorhizobium sp.]|uniref:hypothetical protein n=1 Tax=Mesorhizobium sp. TaxID=1871066 RepID=UPI000FE9B225|nr:hypothetical protein [Mesorhizobium sp.]RWI31449.1 MAG: hypothetical protein EOR13_26645 [Mesorhizobium sp.]TIO54385.1 MAG: hypothetical protein E5X78_04225 [Mesorhizobium sp.]TIO58144.1 MAG: hypothetical protein E5X79_22940 [Mesorhizobium sp.]TJV63871.1 MAG: hypothetical protein E5X80_14635 [Mesorhizobium sp.]